MKKLCLYSVLSIVCVLLSGCASIVDGGSTKVVRVSSNPPGAKVSVFDKNGKPVCEETTPASLRLKREHGYFNPEKYKVVFEAPGYYPSETYIQSNVNGWYFGNVLFGGLVGIVLVDPATGAMWTLSPRDLNWNMVSSTTPLSPDELKAAELKANPPRQFTNSAPAGKKY